MILLIVVVAPVIYSIQLSFHSYSLVIPGKTGQWVGLANYERLIQDAAFGNAILTTIIFVVSSVVLETVIGTLVGIWLHRLKVFQRLVTSALLLPMILAPLIVGLMFNFAFNAQFGYLTWILSGLGIGPTGGMLSQGSTALVALIAADVWEWFPFVALMVVAGLRALPTEPLEAAEIDGATTFQKYWLVVLPMLTPILAVAVLFRTTEAVREFDKVYILTGGGPGSSTVVNDLYQYRVSFANWDLSYGAALSLVTFVVIMALAAVMFHFLLRKDMRQ
ncbi:MULTISPECIES: sugar ABC transporter permease [unclassified Mesorhizobium]|uniref:carbohydrate ABC transporter permease n=1 Tax=unclassified Mesorhizobium TaxID=325217 RepID=UPI0015E34AFD|nr:MULTISPECIES: sugar ABC transporter permease [unclassified Mesorhizobium]